MRAGFWVLKRARIRGDRGVKVFRDVSIQRQALALDQMKNDFSRGGGGRIDTSHVAVTRITQVVVDVNPDFR